MKALAKRLLSYTPYRIVRDRGVNRFDATERCLISLKERGFAPKLVVDGGAHLGWFSLTARQIFPDAAFHLIEPQPACAGSLRALCSRQGFTFHPCALATERGTVQLSRTEEPSTGAHVRLDGSANTVPVPAETLDGLFDWVTPEKRPLLKLDLQGFELFALRGAVNFLKSVEVILTEVSFFSQDYEPSPAELISFLAGSGFALYDVAALHARFRDNRLRQGDLIFVRHGTPLLADPSWA
jgi:FkbM family methyltransferase